MRKVICVGNRYVYPDGAALWVYDSAVKEQDTLRWVEGGLGGLSLITHFENSSRILLLDYIHNVENATLFSLDEILSLVDVSSYSHDTAFYYLLSSLEDYFDKLPNIELLSCDPEKSNYIDEIRSFVAKWEKYEK